MALMENMDTLNQHQKEVGESAGSAKKMMDEAYGQSLDARIQDLKRAFEQLYEKITNSEQLKWLVTEFTQLITALTNVDGKTIAFTATVGGLILVMSKLSTLNKALMMGEAVTGLSKLIGVLTGMTSVKTTIDGVTNATKAMQIAQLGAIAQTEGLTGLKGAWVLLSGGIKEATASALAFMATPIGLLLGALAVTLGLVVGGFISVKQHEEALEQQSKDLKTALDGVNESLKNGDTKGASEKLEKAKTSYKELTDLIRQKNELTSQPVAKEGTNEYYQQIGTLAILNNKIEEHKKVLKDAGLTYDETTGKVKEFTDVELLILNTDAINHIKEMTKAQVENRTNMEGMKEEYDNYISSVQDLYSEYQTLSTQENLSTEQKTQLGSVVEQLQGKIGNLSVTMDENGKVYINNTGLITDTISYLNSEGVTVETLTSIRLADEKANASWQYNNTSITYSETLQRIAYYRQEIEQIKQLMQARMTEALANSQDGIDANGQEAPSLRDESRIMAEYGAKTNKANAEIAKLQAGLDIIDKAYSNPPPVSSPSLKSPSGENYMPSGGGSGKDSAKKAEDELEKSEKKMIDDITDAYNKAKDIISNDIEEIDASITTLGDADDGNFTKRIDLTTQKLAKQREEVGKAQEQLNALKNVTVTTAEAQEALETATLKASKELRQETLEVSKLQSEIEKADIDELKKIFENQKELAEATLESQQKKQTQDLENIKTQQEELHQTKMDNYEAELKALDEQSEKLDEENSQVERQNELQKEQNDLKQKEIDLERLKNQKTIQTYTKDANGNWNFTYTYDKKAVSDKQKEVDEAQNTLDETNRKNALEDSKKEIETQKKQIEELKTIEDKAYEEKKKYLDKYSEDLKEAQDRDKKRIEANYSDIEKMAKDTLKSLEEEHNKDWNSIAESISTRVTQVTKQLNDLKTLQANYTTTEIDEAINSGDISGFLEKNKNKLNQTAETNITEINKHLNEIDATAKNTKVSIDDLTDSYINLSSAKKDNDITDEDVDSRKINVSKITTIDFDGLSKQLENLKDVNSKIKSELDSFYNDKLNKQNQAQNEELASLNKFSQEYLLFTDKFLELLQVVYDFRFSNMVDIVDNAGVLISQALQAWELAYEDFAKIWNKMNDEDHQIANKIEIRDALSTIDNTHTSVVEWKTDKTKLYSTENFEQYASQIGDGISKSLLNKLNNYSSSLGLASNSVNNSSIVNNKSSNSSTTNVNINQLDVNTKDAQNLLNQLLTIVKNKTSLS